MAHSETADVSARRVKPWRSLKVNGAAKDIIV